MELAHDVAAQVLLAAHGHGRLVEARGAAAAGSRGQRAQSGGGRRGRAGGAATHGGEAVVDLDEALQEARQHALLALEHLPLGVEEQLAARQRQQAVADLGQLVGVWRRAGLQSRPGAPPSWSVGPS